MKSASRYFALAAVATAAIAFVGPAAAQGKQPPYDAWCRDVQIGVSGGSVMVCRAYTYEQCVASRTSHTESCYLNPLYDPRFADWRRRNPQY